MTLNETTKAKVQAVRMKLAVLTASLTATAMLTLPASAGPVINGTILDLLSAVAGLMPTFLSLVVAVAPVIITVAVIAFITMFIKRILDMMNL